MEFAAATLNKEDKTFVIHMITLSILDLNIYLSWQTQLSLLNVKKVIILSKYTDYTNVFSLDSTAKLPKPTELTILLLT